MQLVRIAAGLFAPAFLWSQQSTLAAAPDVLSDGGAAKVARVIDGDTLSLVGGAADVRLVGIQAPKLPLGRAGFKPWPQADAARAALTELTKGHAMRLRLPATSKDRNGRILAHVVRDDGLWLQEEMLRRGLARVYTFPDNRQLAPELFAAERDARAARRGIWAEAAYEVRTPDPARLAGDAGNFQIVEGLAMSTAKVQGRVYLNFGDNYRADFTATIAPDVMALFTKDKIDPLALKGKIVRVRGYLRNYNGPVIDITHPEQIETVGAPDQ
ncbi:MAG: thermonuclease family protein [Rhodospirillaceae bacterium]|nr:thermonuclease family protein [Rhodospirillaceae bacterium]